MRFMKKKKDLFFQKKKEIIQQYYMAGRRDLSFIIYRNVYSAALP